MTVLPSTDINTMVNLYSDSLRTLNIGKSITEAHATLTKWHDDSIATIKTYYQQKCDELDEYAKQVEKQFNEKQSKIQTFINEINDDQKKTEQDSNLIKLNCSSIERLLHDMEQLLLKINTNSLNITRNSIQIVKQFESIDLNNPFKSFHYFPESSSAIASSNRYFLMHQHPYLCLIDKNFKIVQQRPWTGEWIRDMCWSSKSLGFIILTDHTVFLYNEELKGEVSLNVSSDGNLFSCTCSDESLYISTCQSGSRIYELNLSNPTEMIKNWQPPLTCKDSDGINDIKYNNNKLALLINDFKEQKKRMDIKLTTDFSTIFSIPLSVGNDIRLFTCCVLPFDEWLVIDGTNSHIYHISNKGKFTKNFHSYLVPYRANLFTSNILALSTENDLRFISY